MVVANSSTQSDHKVEKMKPQNEEGEQQMESGPQEAPKGSGMTDLPYELSVKVSSERFSGGVPLVKGEYKWLSTKKHTLSSNSEPGRKVSVNHKEEPLQFHNEYSDKTSEKAPENDPGFIKVNVAHVGFQDRWWFEKHGPVAARERAIQEPEPEKLTDEFEIEPTTGVL